MRLDRSNDGWVIPDSKNVLLEVFAKKELVDVVKQTIYATCGQQTPVVTRESGAEGELTQIIFDVPVEIADKVTVKIIIALPSAGISGLRKLH